MGTAMTRSSSGRCGNLEFRWSRDLELMLIVAGRGRSRPGRDNVRRCLGCGGGWKDGKYRERHSEFGMHVLFSSASKTLLRALRIVGNARVDLGRLGRKSSALVLSKSNEGSATVRLGGEDRGGGTFRTWMGREVRGGSKSNGGRIKFV